MEGKDKYNVDAAQPFLSHLVELRDRLLRAVLAVLVIFVCLFPFANTIYTSLAGPLQAALPAGSSMVAIDVASPFLTPFKLAMVLSIFLAVPVILHQLWSFVAPGLYKHERRLALPVLVSSTALFYIGMAFAYFVVFPLVFGFMASTTPDGVTMMTDINRYLDFVLTLFFAFGVAFEVPIATFVLVAMGITTPENLVNKRPYVIVGAFVIGMLLTPPDVVSQVLLALPMWLLFELGLLFSRLLVKRRREAEARESANAGAAVGAGAMGLSANDDLLADPERWRPMTDEEMEAELDAMEVEAQPGTKVPKDDDKPKT
ncbi:MAG: twin-arginine translocase subunit TatC [Chromatiales bacterium]|nr:twin-arginine translocase subunit TatC [Chromatiales bacterium]